MPLNLLVIIGVLLIVFGACFEIASKVAKHFAESEAKAWDNRMRHGK